MDTAVYVTNIGKQLNDQLKYTIKIDRLSIKNVILIDHLTNIYNQLETDLLSPTEDFEFTEDDLKKIKQYINCLKKEIKVFEVKDISDDCILTETQHYIIQE